MGFEVGSLQLTDAVNPHNQVELERHLRWNSKLRQSPFAAFSLQRLKYGSELPQCQWLSRLSNTLSPDFFLLDILNEIKDLP
jgi:hypothetical protein